ncbi:succinyldiaminopimelate transaminase [Nakamurella sp. YIM 132087]|uniref:Aminotransferase n=1 Tax=Nakamurella alba TaxID=2665158 RepID=A0A7K1FHJ9_9ACTN|nr:succinyldiaminopimelate transaminase [Nakamurella alba]MTD12929.1 succinyldiaminopimelate transaminase [Nakamurella alba]
MTTSLSPAARLPEFPWDQLIGAKRTAAAHPGGLVDLSIGTPVDPVCTPIRRALGDAANSPGYPTVHGTDALRRSYTGWLARAHGIDHLDERDVLPTLGSKELVASLPAQLGLGAGDVVVIPEIAYPTYEVGALSAGATPVRSDGLAGLGPERPKLVWINSPSNPTGRVLPVEHLAKVVDWARAHGAVVASDECYIDLGWDAQPVSILHPDVSGGDHTNLLAVHSLSKRSNLAGYRVGFVSGDPALIGDLLQLRKHLGFMLSTPIQAAAIAALDDDSHVQAQRGRYEQRRTALAEALESAGYRISNSEAGLYLWATRGEPAAATIERLAADGILAAPGTFYGPGGAQHVRIALTATDERVQAACERLAG